MHNECLLKTQIGWAGEKKKKRKRKIEIEKQNNVV